MKEIKRESTWDYNDDNGYRTVETIETWEWSDELNRYEFVRLEEKETGEYIPYNESDYIRDGAVEIPQAGILINKEAKEKPNLRRVSFKEARENYKYVIQHENGGKVYHTLGWAKRAAKKQGDSWWFNSQLITAKELLAI